MIVCRVEMLNGRCRGGQESTTALLSHSEARPVLFIDPHGGWGTPTQSRILELGRNRRWWVRAHNLTVDQARSWLDSGAEQVLIPASRVGAMLKELPAGTVAVDLCGDADVLGAIKALAGRVGAFRVPAGANADPEWVRSAAGTPVCAVDPKNVDVIRTLNRRGFDVEMPLVGGPVAVSEALRALSPPIDAAMPEADGPGGAEDPFETVTVSFLGSDDD
ncbi:MAG: hypothetical protein AB8H79_10970 [Myxococcota bacterium]